MAPSHGFFERSEKEIVDHIADSVTGRLGDHSTPLAEMQRRQVEAIRQFNEQSSRQTRVMIWLTVVIAILTFVLAVLTGAMLWRM